MEKWKKLGKAAGLQVFILGVILGLLNLKGAGMGSYAELPRRLATITTFVIGVFYLVIPFSVFTYRYTRGKCEGHCLLHLFMAVAGLPLAYILFEKLVLWLPFEIYIYDLEPWFNVLVLLPWTVYLLYFWRKGEMETAFIQNLNVFLVIIFFISFMGSSAAASTLGVQDMLLEPTGDSLDNRACKSALQAKCAVAEEENTSVIRTPASCLTADNELIIQPEDMGEIAEINSTAARCS